jgi:hypothetical protein
VAGIPERIPTRKGPNRQVQADDSAETRRDEDVQPRSESALDATQFGWRDADCHRNGSQRKTRSCAGRADLVAEIGEQAPAAAGATGRVGLGHRHILIEPAYQPINRTATIGP